jgi:hypothetical protein
LREKLSLEQVPEKKGGYGETVKIVVLKRKELAKPRRLKPLPLVGSALARLKVVPFPFVLLTIRRRDSFLLEFPKPYNVLIDNTYLLGKLEL